MSLLGFGRQSRDLGDTSTQLVPPRSRSVGNTTISADSALRHSAVWACLRLRADLMSTIPIKSFRQVGDIQVTVPPTPFLLDPAGDGFGDCDWRYSSQIELDRSGNTFGVITARDGFGLPAQVELAANSKVVVRGTGPRITGYTIGGKQYDPQDVWHERQFTVAGVPLGLSPIAYGAMTIATHLSAQQFALDWFTNGAMPSGTLKNTAKTITGDQAIVVKNRYKAAVQNRDIFVTGADWEFDMAEIKANESQFLDTMKFSILDVARFLGVPGDMIDADAGSTAKITYANITQRNLQLLIMNLGPAIVRRERALSRALPAPRFVQFDTDALLRMDNQTRNAMLLSMTGGRPILTPDEARAQNNLPPFTAAQLEELSAIEASKTPSAPAGTPVQEGQGSAV